MQPIYRLLIVLYLLVPHMSFSQDSTIYFNKKWKPCAKDTASYYRNILVQAGRYNVTDFFLFGAIQMTGSYSSNTMDAKARDGHFAYYDSLGYKIDEGDYSAGRRVGIWYNYFKHSNILRYTADHAPDSSIYYVYFDSLGFKEYEGNYVDGGPKGKWHSYYKHSNSLQCTAEIKPDSLINFIYYDSAFHRRRTKGSELGEKRIGAWQYYYEGSDKVETEEYYDTGSLIKRAVYYDDGVLASEAFPIIPCNTDSVRFYDLKGNYEGACFVYHGTPEHAQLTTNFKRYVKKHLQYPARAKEAGIEGEVEVNFIINEDGSVSNVRTVSGIGGGCDAEAERLVAGLPNLVPSKIGHIPVKSYSWLTVTFKL